MRYDAAIFMRDAGRNRSMPVIEFEPDRSSHPVDLVEHIAAINDWNFERQDADEISISAAGATTTSRSTGWKTSNLSISPAHST
jgi:hypothetical protein